MSMQKVAAILRTIEVVKKSDDVTEEHKAMLISSARREIAEVMGQKSLPLEAPGGAQGAQTKGSKG